MKNRLSSRRLKFGLMLLACILSGAVGCSELAEVIELQDNHSNDYTCQRPGTSDTAVAKSCINGERSAEGLTIAKTGLRGTFCLAEQLHIPFRWNPDLLHFLSIQRT